MDPDHKIAHLWKKRMDRYAEEAYPMRKTTLAIELAQQMKKPKAKLPQLYVNFKDTFEKKTIDELPPIKNLWPCHWTQQRILSKSGQSLPTQPQGTSL